MTREYGIEKIETGDAPDVALSIRGDYSVLPLKVPSNRKHVQRRVLHE